MRLSVKAVGGCECECEASPDSSVESLKRDVEAKLKLGKETEQKLLFRGKALKGKGTHSTKKFYAELSLSPSHKLATPNLIDLFYLFMIRRDFLV